MLKRIARVTLPIAGRAVSASTQGAAASVASRLVDRMNSGELRAAPPPLTPAELPTTAGLASTLAPNVQQPFDELRTLPRWLVILILLAVLVSLLALGPWIVLAAARLWAIAVAVLAPAAHARVRRGAARQPHGRARAGRGDSRAIDGADRTSSLTSELDRLVRSRILRFSFRRSRRSAAVALPTPRAPIGATTDSADARVFRRRAADLFGELSVAPAPSIRESASMCRRSAHARHGAHAARDDRGVVQASTRHPTDLPWQPSDPIEPVMAYPKFDRPMYEPLRELGQDWLLPGLDQIQPNTVTLMLANQRFIEAYMMGLNHEMSRELRWNEYLTDLRGSYFRQFWDVRGAEPSPGQTLDPEQLKDIREIHTWPKASQLGQNSPRPPVPPGEERLVLVVRGDLVRRYPNTEVYALQARLPATDRSATSARRGRIRSSAARCGPISSSSDSTSRPRARSAARSRPILRPIRAGSSCSRNSRPSRASAWTCRRRSAAASTTGTTLSWGNLAASANDLAQLRHIDLDAQLPDSRPIVDANQPVWHADSGLGRTGSRSAGSGVDHPSAARADRDPRVRHAAEDELTMAEISTRPAAASTPPGRRVRGSSSRCRRERGTRPPSSRSRRRRGRDGAGGARAGARGRRADSSSRGSRHAARPVPRRSRRGARSRRRRRLRVARRVAADRVAARAPRDALPRSRAADPRLSRRDRRRQPRARAHARRTRSRLCILARDLDRARGSSGRMAPPARAACRRSEPRGSSIGRGRQTPERHHGPPSPSFPRSHSRRTYGRAPPTRACCPIAGSRSDSADRWKSRARSAARSSTRSS